MRKNRTILEKIGISEKILGQWKKQGLKISYPMKTRERFFKSRDGIFVESADKFVPPLTKKETALYIRHPEKFREDYLKNVRFYFKFHTFLYSRSFLIDKLDKNEEKLITSLSLMYLFLSAMDHHHYHFDRYLVYEDYPETPVGFWWQKLKDFYFKVFGNKVNKNSLPPNFLLTVAHDPIILEKYKLKLSKNEYKQFERTLKMIKIFEDIQQKEGEIISGFPAKEDLLLKTGFGLWDKLCDLIKKYPNYIQKKHRLRILKLIKGHPIASTRVLLLLPQLKSFNKRIFSEFKSEIKRWL